MMIDIIYENCNNLTSVKNWQLIIKRTKYIIRYIYLIAFLWREKYIILWQYNKVFINILIHLSTDNFSIRIFLCIQRSLIACNQYANDHYDKKAIFEFN